MHFTARLRSPIFSTLSVREEQILLTASPLPAPTAAASLADHALDVSVALLLLQSLALLVNSKTPILVLVLASSQRQQALAVLAGPLSELSHVLDALFSVQAQTLAVL